MRLTWVMTFLSSRMASTLFRIPFGKVVLYIPLDIPLDMLEEPGADGTPVTSKKKRESWSYSSFPLLPLLPLPKTNASIEQIEQIEQIIEQIIERKKIKSKRRLKVFQTSHKNIKIQVQNTGSYTFNLQSDPSMSVQSVVGTGRYTTSTTNMYHDYVPGEDRTAFVFGRGKSWQVAWTSIKSNKTLVLIRLVLVCPHQLKFKNEMFVYIQPSKGSMSFRIDAGTGSYTTSTTNMYHTDFTYLIKSNIEKKRAFDRIGNVSQT